MAATIGKTLRLAEFWQAGTKSLLIDATLPGALGPLPGLESPSGLVERLAPRAHGLILNPGLAERYADRFAGKLGAASLVRLDWTNLPRPADFALPLHSVQRVPLASPTDAVQIGATAAVATLLLGFDEDFEAANIQAIAFMCRESVRVALPLLADVVLAGPKIEAAKRDAAIQLGVSFMVEAGTDGIIIPLPAAPALKLLLDFSPVPLFLRVDTAEDLAASQNDLGAALAAGCAGIVIGSHALADAGPVLDAAGALVGMGVSPNAGKQQRLYRILNPSDGRAVCVAADHGWMSDFTPNVAELRRIVGQVVEGGADAILLSLGQAMRLGDLLKGRNTPALLVRADWMNMPRLGGSNVANAIPQQELRHLAIATAQDALDLGASAITIYLFLGFDDETEARNLATCAAFAQECRRIGLVCIIEPLAVGASVTGANIVDVLITGARMAVEVGADMLKIPFTGDVESFRRLVQAAEVPVLALGGARSERDTDALELVAEALEAGGAGTVFGRNVTKAPDPAQMVRDLCAIVHQGRRVEDLKPVEKPGVIQLKGLTELCTGCLLCEINCSLVHDYGGNPLYSTVKIYSPQPDRAYKRKTIYTPRHCTLCNVCVEKCPEGALYIAEGMVHLIEEKCNACHVCVDECPLGVIAFRDDQPIFCDLCGGDPACVRTCPENAIIMLERGGGNGAG